MTLRALWPVVQQFQNKNGSILAAGRVYVYYKNRTALATTYHDEEGTVVNPNPVLLDNNGRATVFADTIYSYTIVVCDYYGKELFSQDINLNSQEGGLDKVHHDSTLSGDGTHDSPLSVVNGGGGTTYTAGDAIDITDNAISVKYSKGLELNSYNQLEVKSGKGLELNSDNQLEVKSGKGLTFDNNNNLKVSVGKGINFDSNGKLTTELPDDWIEITNEWVFVNNFRLQYNGDLPGYGNEMTIWYSKIRKLVKFTGTMRVNTPSSFSNSEWHVFMQYTGNRFYTTYNAPNVSLAPKVYPTQIGGITSVPATRSTGVTLNALMKLSYIGAPDSIPEYCGLGMQLFIPSNTAVNGAVMQGLQLSVTPIE